MRIGIPRALLYYYYYPLWEKFLTALGHEVVVSPHTNKQIMNEGSKVSVPEICVPIKVFNGHVLELLETSDYIFAPRMVSVEKNKTFCPKFLALPDMLRYTFPEQEERFICPYIEGRADWSADPLQLQDSHLLRNYSVSQLSNAWQKGVITWQRFRDICRRGYRIDEALELYKNPVMPEPKANKGKINIALIGYVYDVYDIFVGMEIAKRLDAMDVNVKTFEMLKDEELNEQIKPMTKSLFWTFSNKAFGAGLHYYQDPEIDGLIHLTAFGCGPDSFSGKMMELDSNTYAKPFLTVRVDEQSGENHLQTRIEAFVDMLVHKKYKDRA